MDQQLFRQRLQASPDDQTFQASMDWITSRFHYQPTAFSNGPVRSEAGQNEGSCKIFAMAQLVGLSEQECLHCFGDYYREDVLKNPMGQDHANIRQFMKTGFAGLHFSRPALTTR